MKITQTADKGSGFQALASLICFRDNGMREIRGRAQTKGGRLSQKQLAKQYSSTLIVAASGELRVGLRALLTATPEIGLVTEAHDDQSALRMV